MKLTRRDFSIGLAAGLAAPALIRSAAAQGATIKIGMVLPVTGSAAEQGKFALNGAKLAVFSASNSNS
jgi:branched-chain amino acid transport system substrate-binding protein